MVHLVIFYTFLFGTTVLYAECHYHEQTISRSSNVKITNEARLFGFVFSTKWFPDIFGCAHACLGTELCASFNFQSRIGEKGMCELNSLKLIYHAAFKPQHHAEWTYGFLTGKSYGTLIGKKTE